MPGFLYSQLFVKPAYPSASVAGQYVVVTGSNTGLGKEAARHFARMGAAKVVLAVRNAEAGRRAKADIDATAGCGAGVVEVWDLDLASYASCRAFADRAAGLPRLDVVVENAGIATDAWSVVEGHERTVLINVVSTFYLALLLLPKLKASAKQQGTPAHLSIVTSEVHGWTKFAEHKAASIFDALNDRSKSKMSERYQTSKLLEVLAVRQLAPLLAGSGVTLNMLNPGLCHSELARDAGLALAALKFALARTTEMGSRTLVAAAVAGPESHGKYMHNGVVADEEVSKFVKSEVGRAASAQVWRELSGILERIQPGVTSNI